MGLRINHAENVAMRKLGDMPDGFAFYRWEVVGPDTVVFTGGPTRIITRGPKKGSRRWLKTTHKVAVTKAEEQEEIKRYEKETGNCGQCGGDGKEWFGWGIETGNRFRDCSRCNSTGKAPL